MKKKIVLTESELIRVIKRIIKETEETNLDFQQIIIVGKPEQNKIKLSNGEVITNVTTNSKCTNGTFNKNNLPEGCIVRLNTADKKSYNCSKEGCFPIDQSRTVDRFDDAAGKDQGKTVKTGKIGQALGRPVQKTRASF